MAHEQPAPFLQSVKQLLVERDLPTGLPVELPIGFSTEAAREKVERSFVVLVPFLDGCLNSLDGLDDEKIFDIDVVNGTGAEVAIDEIAIGHILKWTDHPTVADERQIIFSFLVDVVGRAEVFVESHDGFLSIRGKVLLRLPA